MCLRFSIITRCWIHGAVARKARQTKFAPCHEFAGDRARSSHGRASSCPKEDTRCQMATRQSVRVVVLTLAGATLAGCAQQTVTERLTSRGVSSQALPAQAATQRRASVAHH